MLLCLAVSLQSIFSIALLVIITIKDIWSVSGNNSNCSHKYADDISNIIGREFFHVIKDTMDALSKRHANLAHNKEAKLKLIMNIGPGTSGTRSLFIAATQLNITSFHSGASSLNCSAYYNHEMVNYESSYDIKTMKIMDNAHIQYALWGDIPAPNFWWNILHRFQDRTIFIMTDVEDYSWLLRRKKKSVNAQKNDTINYYWTVPIAFHPKELHFTDRTLSLERRNNITETLLRKLNVVHVTNDTNSRCFDAYRRFVRCAIPPEKLLWLSMREEQPQLFWKKLTTFIGLNVSKAQLDRLIDAGVPYVGSSGCNIGRNNCSAIDGISHPTPNLCQG